jgi:hypothetical protein
MIVIGHLAKCMNHPIKPRTNNVQHRQPIIAIIVTQEDIFPTISARGNVIKGTGEFQSEGSGHLRSLAQIVGMLELTPFLLLSLEDFKALEETAYLLRTPANAKRLLSAATQLNTGKGLERKLVK